MRMEKRLPQDKIDKICSQLKSLSVRKRVTLTELQSIIGLLSFACPVVVPGRAFLRRLIDLSMGLKKPYHKKRLNMEARADIKAWLVFMESFNGKSLFLPTFWDSFLSLNLYTDASNSGFGGYLGTSWFAETWPQAFTDLHITIKELFPIVLALELWDDRLADKCITFHFDNLSVVYVVDKQSSKDKFVMRLVRRLVIKCMTYNINFQAALLPGIDNTFADLLSRQKIADFLLHFPLQNPVRHNIPDGLLQI